MSEPGLNELLPLERGLVFAVLAKIAQLHGAANLAGQRDVQLVLQPFDFLSKSFLQGFNHESGPAWVQKFGARLVSRAPLPSANRRFLPTADSGWSPASSVAARCTCA